MEGEGTMLRSGKQLGKDREDERNAQHNDLMVMEAGDARTVTVETPAVSTPVVEQIPEVRRPLGARPKVLKVYESNDENAGRGSQSSQRSVAGAADLQADQEASAGSRRFGLTTTHCLEENPVRPVGPRSSLVEIMPDLDGAGLQGNSRHPWPLPTSDGAGLQGSVRQVREFWMEVDRNAPRSRPVYETGRQVNLGLLRTPERNNGRTPREEVLLPTQQNVAHNTGGNLIDMPVPNPVYQERAEPPPVYRERTITIKMKPPIYDGTTSWDDYLVQFELIAQLNGWTPRTWASYLAASLCGAAQAVLGDLDAPRRQDYGTLVASLNQRFGSENQTEMFRAILKTRIRKPNETLPELAQAIRRLVKQPYPTAPYELLESLACDHFVDALADFDTRWRIQQTRPQSIDQAVRVAVELDAFQEAERQRGIFRKNIRAIKSVSFKEDMDVTGNSDAHHSQPNQDMSKLMFAIELINKRLENVENSSRPRRQPRCDHAEVECYNCGQLGHIRPQCPVLNGQRNSLSKPRSHGGHHSQRNGNSGN